jgi:hypothetical protein
MNVCVCVEVVRRMRFHNLFSKRILCGKEIFPSDVFFQIVVFNILSFTLDAAIPKNHTFLRLVLLSKTVTIMWVCN